MADLVIANKSDLVSIASAIRELNRTSNDMSLNEMKTNVNDAIGNITQALSALSEKGVEVPNNAGSGELAELIGAIETSGGYDYEIGIYKYILKEATFTPAEDMTEINIYDLVGYLGSITSLISGQCNAYGFVIYKQNAINTQGYVDMLADIRNLSTYGSRHCAVCYTASYNYYVTKGDSMVTIDYKSGALTMKNYPFKTGCTYRIMAVLPEKV